MHLFIQFNSKSCAEIKTNEIYLENVSDQCLVVITLLGGVIFHKFIYVLLADATYC